MLFDSETLIHRWRQESTVQWEKPKNSWVRRQLPKVMSEVSKMYLYNRKVITDPVPAGPLLILPFLSSCKGQSLQKESEHAARMDGYMQAG